MKMQAHGWYMHKFILTPDELLDVFTGFTALSDDNQTPDFFEQYSLFYEKLKSGHLFTWKDDLAEMKLATYLVTEKQQVNFTEAHVEIRLFPLVLIEQSLHANLACKQYPQFVVGTAIYFPRNIQYMDSKEKKVTKTVLGKEFAEYTNYQLIVARIKKITIGLTFTIAEKAYKPTIRISRIANQDFQYFYFCQYHRCVVKRLD